MKQSRKRSITEYSQHHSISTTSNKFISRSESSLLDHQMLRIQVCEKQDKIRSIFKKNQKQLCDFFIKEYRPMPYSKINLNRVLNQRTEEIRLIKNSNRIYFGGIDQAHRKIGQGIMIDEKGKIYEGTFFDNIKQGFGVEIYPNGNLYIGQFDNNKKHGEGKFYWFSLSPPIKEGSKYVQFYSGLWWGGLPDGKGSHQKNTGDIYEGYFKNGLKHGEGYEYFYNGDYYKGEYVNGLPEGFGLYTWKDRSKYEGDFKQGLRNGHGLWVSADAKQEYRGQYTLDKKCGYGQYIWNGKGYLYKGHFENDLRHGYGQLFHNGQLEFKGQWIDGQADQKDSMQDLKSSKARKTQKSFIKTPKSEKLPSLSRLRPPASSIIKRKKNDGFESNRYQPKYQSRKKSPAYHLKRSRSPSYSNNSEGPVKIAKTFTLSQSKKLKKPLDRKTIEATIKKRPISSSLRKIPSLQNRKSQKKFTLLKCTKSKCGCNINEISNPQSTKKKAKKKIIIHSKTEDFCF